MLLALVAYSGFTREPLPPTLPPTATYPPGREPMFLPANYRENFVYYAQVDRSDGVTRKLYINRTGLEAARAGQELPDYTQLIIEAYDAARDVFGNVLRDEQGRLIALDRDPAAVRISTPALAEGYTFKVVED